MEKEQDGDVLRYIEQVERGKFIILNTMRGGR